MKNDEMSEILSIAVHELKSMYGKPNIVMIQSVVDIDDKDYKSPVLLHMTLNEEVFIEYEHIANLKIVNLVEAL